MNNLFAPICWIVSIIVSSSIVSSLAMAQPGDESQDQTAVIQSPGAQTAETRPTENHLGERTASDKKMVRSANINLRTTVTGNQEQPRVMYILPWQSPTSPELDMEMLSSQQDAVFGHVERDEWQRSLESSGELDETSDQ